MFSNMLLHLGLSSLDSVPRCPWIQYICSVSEMSDTFSFLSKTAGLHLFSQLQAYFYSPGDLSVTLCPVWYQLVPPQLCTALCVASEASAMTLYLCFSALSLVWHHKYLIQLRVLVTTVYKNYIIM